MNVGDLVRFVGHRTDNPILGLVMAIEDVDQPEPIVQVMWVSPPVYGRLNVAMVPSELEIVSRPRSLK